MARVRLSALLICGILITTGGCAGSATAPEAATAESFAANKSGKPTTGTDTDQTTTMSSMDSGYLTTGGRH